MEIAASSCFPSMSSRCVSHCLEMSEYYVQERSSEYASVVVLQQQLHGEVHLVRRQMAQPVLLRQQQLQHVLVGGDDVLDALRDRLRVVLQVTQTHLQRVDLLVHVLRLTEPRALRSSCSRPSCRAACGPCAGRSRACCTGGRCTGSEPPPVPATRRGSYLQIASSRRGCSQRCREKSLR